MIMNGIIQIALRARNFRNTINLKRSISLLPSNCKKNNNVQGNFTPLYRFPYIVPFSLINRLKVYQTGISAISIPTALCLNQLEYISAEAVQFTVVFGLCGCLVFYSLGYLTQNFIGYIYYDEEKDLAKISYIDFWGRRKDIEVPPRDIMPLNELPSSFWDGLYSKFRRFSTSETLKFSLTYGIVLDKDKIKLVM